MVFDIVDTKTRIKDLKTYLARLGCGASLQAPTTTTRMNVSFILIAPSNSVFIGFRRTFSVLKILRFIKGIVNKCINSIFVCEADEFFSDVKC